MDHHERNTNKQQAVITIQVLVPEHVSVRPPPDAYLLDCHTPGVLWRGMAPIFLEAPESIAQRLLHIIVLKSSHGSLLPSSSSSKDGEEGDHVDVEQPAFPGFRNRQLLLSVSDKKNNNNNNNINNNDDDDDKTKPSPPSPLSTSSILICLQPPLLTPSVESDMFSSIVIQVEHSLLRLQTLSAWMATLGGGYFFCRRLSIALYLARHQRRVALHIGNQPMARQCRINEAYNLLYAGHFKPALSVLQQLEAELPSDDTVTRNQCQAARVLAKRLKQVAKQGLLQRYHPTEKGTRHAIDDYQRIRIVQEEDEKEEE
jgi:hypothetical protein